MVALIEKTATGYRAATGKPLEAEAEGFTREETLQKLGVIVAERLALGGELVELTLPQPQSESHPLAEFAGDMKNDPLYPEWVTSMREYRAERERELAGE